MKTKRIKSILYQAKLNKKSTAKCAQCLAHMLINEMA
jgi:hypothetical protein